MFIKVKFIVYVNTQNANCLLQGWQKFVDMTAMFFVSFLNTSDTESNTVRGL